MFLPDRAIQNEDEDQLNRSGFAKRLAETINDWNKDDSIVIGLYGPWGSGKTSVVNLTINYLLELTKDWKPTKKPIIIWFNPWNYIEREQLLRAFFQQILSEIGKTEPNRKSDFKRALETFGETLGVLENVPAVGQYLQMGGKIIGLITHDKSLKEEKENLDSLFKKLKRRIVIILDDIDRLTNEEIRLLFQIIKINADFPNTMYLAAFDRNIVENALSKEQGINGRDYLEKIVQVGFNIPRADHGLIQQYLYAELDKVLANIDQNDLDINRWAGLFQNGFRELFVSIRDVKRYINSLDMTLMMIKLEIDPIDYIGLEAIRVFLPKVYQRIGENKSLFLQDNILEIGERNHEKVIKETLENIFSSDGDDYVNISRGISLQLFPKLGRFYSNMSYSSGWQSQWLMERRICTGKFFDTYFLLGTPKGDVSQVELNQIIIQATNQEKINKFFIQYTTEGRIRRAIDGLRHKIDQMNIDQCKGLIKAVIELMNTLPDLHEEFLDFGSDRSQFLLIRDLLNKLEQEDRYHWFKPLILEQAPLFPSVFIVTMDLPRENRQRENPIFLNEQLDELKHICVKKIVSHAKNGLLLKQKGLSFIMFRWNEWKENNGEFTSFLKWIQEDTHRCLEFINEFIYEIRSETSGEYIAKIEKEINLPNIYKFLNEECIKMFLEKIDSVDQNSFTIEEQQSLSFLRTALNRE